MDLATRRGGRQSRVSTVLCRLVAPRARAAESAEGNFLVPKQGRFKNIVRLYEIGSIDWLGQAGTGKWADGGEICRLKNIVPHWTLRNYPLLKLEYYELLRCYPFRRVAGFRGELRYCRGERKVLWMLARSIGSPLPIL